MTKGQFGIDAFLQSNHYPKKLRYALVTNNVATTSDGEPSRLALLKAGFTIKKLFSPEHGLTAKGEDGNTAQGIVGAWSLDKDTVKSKLFLFFPNNRFMLIEPTGQTVQSEPLACGKPGIEFAAYSYDGASKALKITSFIFDTNACAGLSESADKLVTFDISSDGNRATLTKQGQAAVKLSRVSN